MLTNEEEKFLEYWQEQRTRKSKSGFNIGFPVAVIMVFGIFMSVLGGWHKQAAAALSSDFSTIVVIVIAAVAIVVFMTLFSLRYQREQKEQRYNELLAKKQKSQQA